MPEELSVAIREDQGKKRNRRLRESGQVPAILYGHGEKNVCLSVPADELDALVHHGARMVQLTGALNESAFVRSLQWDTWGTAILHVDFTRVSAGEKVELEVTIELRGEAPGVKEGGVVEHLLHQVAIECPAGSIPERLEVSINELHLGQAITAAELELPQGASLQHGSDEVVVQCSKPVEVAEEAAEAAPGEPEVIGAKEEEQEEG